MQPRNLGLYLALLLFATATARPQYEYDYDDYNYGEEVEKMDEVELQPEFTIKPQHLVARKGDSVVIPCPSINSESHPMLISRVTPMNYILFVGEVPLRQSRKHKLIGDSLEISDLEPNDSGDYLCSFTVNHGTIKLTHTLEVQFPPVLRSKPEQQQLQRVSQGESVTLVCDAYGNPKPIITWTKLEGSLPSGSEEKEDHSITLENADRHMEGNYMCSAYNGIGEAASQTFAVSVDYAPEVTAEKESIMTDMGNHVKLTCLVYANPAAVVAWTKDGQLIFPETVTMEQVGHRYTIGIHQMHEADFGTYICHAHNLLGKSDVAIQVTERSQPTEEEEKGPKIIDERDQQMDEEKWKLSLGEERGHEIIDERTDPIQEERDHQIEEERGQQVEEEMGHQIQEEWGHQIEEERGNQIGEERDHQTEEGKGHQIIAERDYPIRKEKKQATDTEWQKLIIITSDLAHLLGKMWGKL